MLPPRIHGSIAHDPQFVVAAFTKDSGLKSIGVDIELMTPLSSEIAAVILCDDDPPLDSHLAITLKKAVYKAWSAAGGRVLEHHEVRLQVFGRMFWGEVIPDGAICDGGLPTAAYRWLAIAVSRY